MLKNLDNTEILVFFKKSLLKPISNAFFHILFLYCVFEFLWNIWSGSWVLLFRFVKMFVALETIEKVDWLVLKNECPMYWNRMKNFNVFWVIMIWLIGSGKYRYKKFLVIFKTKLFFLIVFWGHYEKIKFKLNVPIYM